jgi:hypothetical protein
MAPAAPLVSTPAPPTPVVPAAPKVGDLLIVRPAGPPVAPSAVVHPPRPRPGGPIVPAAAKPPVAAPRKPLPGGAATPTETIRQHIGIKPRTFTPRPGAPPRPGGAPFRPPVGSRPAGGPGGPPSGFRRVNRDRLHLRQKERRQRPAIIVEEMQGRMERTVHLRRSRKESKTCDEEEGHRSRPLPVPRHSSHSQ